MLLLQEQPSLTSEEPFLRSGDADAANCRRLCRTESEAGEGAGLPRGRAGREGLHPRCSYPPESVEESKYLVLNLITRAIKP